MNMVEVYGKLEDILKVHVYALTSGWVFMCLLLENFEVEEVMFSVKMDNFSQEGAVK